MPYTSLTSSNRLSGDTTISTCLNIHLSFKYVSKILRKKKLSLIRTNTCAYHGVRHVGFSDILHTYYVLSGWSQTISKSIPGTFDEFQDKLNLEKTFESFDFNCFSSNNWGVILRLQKRFIGGVL